MSIKILVRTDFSEYSDRALEGAPDIAKQYHAKVLNTRVMVVVREEFGHILRKEAEERLQKQLDKFPQAKEIEVAAGIRRSSIYEEILEQEKKKKGSA